MNIIPFSVDFFNLSVSKNFNKLFHLGFIEVINNLPFESKDSDRFWRNKYMSSDSSNKSVTITNLYFFQF